MGSPVSGTLGTPQYSGQIGRPCSQPEALAELHVLAHTTQFNTWSPLQHSAWAARSQAPERPPVTLDLWAGTGPFAAL